MDIFSVIMLAGGLALFLFGMNVMSAGLEKMAGSKLESGLRTLTSNRFKGLALGAGVTAVIQSSSAVTVMLVGLVNSGIMQLGQTIGVIMGSNIGTTMTAWILSLTGIEGGNLFLNLLKPMSFSPVLALIGVILTMTKSEKKKHLGEILIGFAVLMYGMDFMSQSMDPLAESETFRNILTMFENPLFGVLAGALITAVIQSSSASVGILQALAGQTGTITYGIAIPIIMGQNIGTCISAFLSSIGTNKNARRVAVIHVSFNFIGTAICLALFYGLNAIFKFPLTGWLVDEVGIACVHTIFNVFTTCLLIGFTKQLEKLACRIIKDKEQKEEFTFIDERLLASPSIAARESEAKANEMCAIAFDSISTAIELIDTYDEKKAQNILEYENQLDMYEDKLGTYLVKLSREEMSAKDSDIVSKLLHAIGDFERIGDHAVNLLKVAEELKDKGLKFSAEATEEIKVMSDALNEILSLTKLSFQTSDTAVAEKVEPLEQVIDGLIKKTRARHIDRLSRGECTIELGFVLADLLNNFERVSDHCSNIAVAVIEIDREEMDTHEYLNAVKYSDDKKFNDSYAEYKAKYYI